MNWDALLHTPGGHKFWNEHGKHSVHDDFRNAVKQILSKDEAPYSMDFKT